MNVLILTPDRVGSTLLQRVLTVYMLRQGFDKPVINLHELTNGLIKYHNPVLNTEILGKPDKNKTPWGYWQTLDEIVSLLESADHYKTSRLAHYHLINRGDSIADQLKFYEYLNKNFYIISCRRDNLLEHALSWEITAHSKNLNVYNIEEKLTTYNNIYKNKITASKQSIITHLNKYRNYINWSNNYFNIQSYFNYDTDVHNIENYILDLYFMSRSENTWQDMFGQDFNSWNTCHRMLPNLILREVANTYSNEISFIDSSVEDKWQIFKGAEWPESAQEFESQKNNLPVGIREEILSSIRQLSIKVTEQEYNFLKNNISNYKSTNDQISNLINDGFLVTGIPIKLQSLLEKKLLVENFDEVVQWYNEWVDQNNFGIKYQETDLAQLINIEENNLSAAFIAQITQLNH